MNELPRTRPNILSLYFIGVSLIGLLLLAAFTFRISTLNVNFPWRKPAIGSIFGLICLLGIIAGVYPSKCSRMLHFQKKTRIGRLYKAEQGTIGGRAITFEGHHPSCGKFSAHVFQLSGKIYCAGCMGLVIGAVISLFGTSAYFFTELFPGEIGIVLYWLGFLWVTLSLLQYNLFSIHRSFIHLFLNVIFVLGASFLFIGIDIITSNLVLEGYFITMTLFWILTRILLSQQEHRKICLACGLKACRFLE